MLAIVAASGETVRLLRSAVSSTSSLYSFSYQRSDQPCPGIEAYWFFWNEKTTSVTIGRKRKTKARPR
jgi:hypothetical protein